MAKYKIGFVLLIILLTILTFFVSHSVKNNPCQMLDSKNLALTSQILIVKSTGGFKAEITACQKQDEIWQPALQSSFPGVIGKNGIAALGTKKEGDWKTPAGQYPFGEAFGSQPLALKMDYKYITSEDKFIDDIGSNAYNTWIIGKTDAKSYEPMLIALYKIGAVINYNMNPAIPGAGSAIFMHIWRSSEAPTAGCVAMDEKHLLAILHWLDKKQHPYIYIIN